MGLVGHDQHPVPAGLIHQPGQSEGLVGGTLHPFDEHDAVLGDAKLDRPALLHLGLGPQAIQVTEGRAQNEKSGPAIAYQVLWPAYAARAVIPDAKLPAGAQVREATFGDLIELAGYRLEDRVWSPAGHELVTLYWRARDEVPQNYSVFVHAYKADGTLVAQSDSYPAAGTLPTRDWRPGTLVVDTHRLDLPAIEPVGLRVDVGLYGPDGRRLETGEGDRVRLASVVVWPDQDRDRLKAQEAVFGDQIALLESAVGQEAPRRLEVEIVLGALERPERDYTIFVHLVGPDGRVWDQADRMPLDGTYPTSQWSPGDRALGRYELRLPPAAPAGTDRVTMGPYFWQTGERLRLRDGDDALDLGRLSCDPGRGIG